MERNKWELARYVVSQVLVGMSYICHQFRPYFVPIPFTKAMHLNLSKAAKNYCAICFKFDVSNVKMSSASGSLPQTPKDFALGTDQRWKETNENLHEMLCLKHQCRPMFYAIIFCRTSSLSHSERLCLGTCQTRQKTSVKWLKSDLKCHHNLLLNG